jgi:hypothetical protein
MMSYFVKMTALGMLALTACFANSPNAVPVDASASMNGETGVEVESGRVGNTVPGTPDHLPALSACVSPHAPKPRGLRRLTGREVSATLAAIFNANDVPPGTEAFGGDTSVYGFDNVQSALNIYNGGVIALQVYAEAVGNYASTHVAQISTCTGMDGACRTGFITQFGKAMFRRPLSTEEVQGFDGLMGGTANFVDGVKAVVSAMVQSPYFVYRTELGTPRGADYVLGPYEVASALSYLLTGAPPDAALMAAADANALGDTQSRLGQAQRLLATPQAKTTLGRFMLQWLQVDTLDAVARTEGSLTLSTSLKAAMRQEVQMAVEKLWSNPNTLLAEVFTTPTTYLNGELATFYGAPNAGSATFAPVSLASFGRDPGVLAMGGVIAAASQTNVASPVLRGRMVRMRMLCGTIPSPPSSVPPISAQAATDGTVRGTYVAHTANPACAGCHQRMDPLGFTFGHYDTIGRRRPGNMENGIPVDTSGKVTGVGDADVPLSGLADLVAFLAQSDAVGACFARHWAMYAYGAVSWAEDQCTHDDVAEVARTAHFNLRATVLGLIALPSFVTRSSDA